MAWTNEKTEQLKKLWSEGHTASQIARILGEGISRNAVIGKAHRLNLAGRTQSRMISSPRINNYQPKQNKGPATRRRRPRGLRAIVIEKDFEPENPTSLENLTDKTCRWPIGHPDEKDFYFCGRSPMEDRIYCKLHVSHAYQPRGFKGEEPAKGGEELPEFIEKKVKSA
jgi:GcrA cell cycle regulator